MAEITFNGVWKRYPDGFEAVKDMNLDIRDGEFMILVGPSGCGKSTALRMVAGLEEITEGELIIGGERVNELAPRDRDIAMVFQNYALYPHMTVRDNMGFALKLAKVDKGEIDRKVQEAASILELEQHLDRKPANLSGGQRQRVAMGRAIVRDPKAFLMDAPLSNLDAKLRVQMRTQVARIQHQLGTTMLYVTHDQTEAMTLGDRVAVMRGGIIQQVDSPRELYNNPRNIFVAGFIGSPAMNFFAAHVEDGKVRLPFGELLSCSSWRISSPPLTLKYAYSSDPIDSTTSSLARNFIRPAPSPSTAASSKCSGRAPAITSMPPLWPPGAACSLRRSSSPIGASPNGSLTTSPSSRAGRKFIAGEPMKPATNRFAGSW